MTDDLVVIRPARGEALVLFEWLVGLGDRPVVPNAHSAEIVALCRLQGALESALVEIFQPDYREKLAAARDALLRRFGEPS